MIDEAIARHIVAGHKSLTENTGKSILCLSDACDPIDLGSVAGRAKTPFTSDQMRRYIQFCRTLNPTMTPESKKVLVECYRLLRQNDILGKIRWIVLHTILAQSQLL